MTAVPFSGSPAVSPVANPSEPPATAEDVERSWARWSTLDPSGFPDLAEFLRERGLNVATGQALGFRQRECNGPGLCLGLNLGNGIKRRSLSEFQGKTLRAVEPAGRRVSWTGLAIIPGASSPTRQGESASTVVVCESETDLWAVGQLAPSFDLALMPAGARTWREEWAAPLHHYDRVLVATDDDDAGDLGASKIAFDVPAAVRLRPVSNAKDWCEVLSRGLLDSDAFLALAEAASEPIRHSRIARERVHKALNRLAEETGLSVNAKGLVALASSELKLPESFIRAVADELAYPTPKIGVWTGPRILERSLPDERPEIFGKGQWIEGEILGIAGQAGVGKTLVALQAGLSLALGLPFFLSEEVPIPRARRVLYVAGEGTAFTFEERFRSLSAEALAIGGGGALENFRTLGPDGAGNVATIGPGGGIGLKLDLANHLGLLLPRIDEFEPEVLILDPIRALHSKNENDSQEMEEFFFLLRDRLVRERGLSLLMTHHLRKGASLDANAARGGSWQENVATSWLLALAGRDQDLTLRATKTRSGSPIPELRVDRDPETLWHRGARQMAAADEFASLAERLFDWFTNSEMHRTLKWSKLMSDWGIREKRAQALRAYLRADGRFYFTRSDAPGRPWRIGLKPPDGAPALLLS